MTVILLTICLLGTVTATPAIDLSGALQRCAEIPDRDQRLECYDSLASRPGSSEPEQHDEASAAAVGNWELTKETSPIDDSALVYLSLMAEVVTPEAPRTVLPTLFIRCKENRVESFINWGIPVGTGTVTVTTRLDEDEAQTSKWLVSTDFTGTFVRGSHSAFIAKLRSHDRLVARLVPLAQNETTAIFNLAGLPEVIGEVYAACNTR